MTPFFERRWVCQVFTSGYHNGCICSPEEPHDGWECGYKWVAPRLKDTETGRLVAERINWFVEEMRASV